MLTLLVKWILIIVGFNHHATKITRMLEKVEFHTFKIYQFFAAIIIFWW